MILDKTNIRVIFCSIENLSLFCKTDLRMCYRMRHISYRFYISMMSISFSNNKKTYTFGM